MIGLEQIKHPFDRLTHRLLEDHGKETVTSYLGLAEDRTEVTAIDTKLTAAPMRLSDKLFLVRPQGKEAVLLHWEFFMQPAERCSPTVNLYAALIGLLQTQKEYRGTALQSVVVFFRPGPEQYAQPYHAHQLTDNRESIYPYEVIKLWDTKVETLMHRFPAPWAVLGPFCAGDLVKNVLTSSNVLHAARPAMQRERWEELREYLRFVITATVRRQEDMERLRDIIKKEDVEDFWIYKYFREQGREEAREGAICMLTAFLEQKFGAIPPEILAKVKALQNFDEAKAIMDRAFHADTIEDAF